LGCGFAASFHAFPLLEETVMNRLVCSLTPVLLMACFLGGVFLGQQPAVAQQPNQEQLQKLEWLVGTWACRGRTAEGESYLVTRKYQWALDENYITCFSVVRVGGKVTLVHRHMIGWDPSKGIYRTWVFSSNGDFVRAVWPDVEGDQRSGTLAGLTPNNEQISAKAVYTRVDDDTLRYQVSEYTIGGQTQPDMDLTFKRAASSP
jgi:hypothetical protein